MQNSQDRSTWNVPCRDAEGRHAHTVVEVTGDDELVMVSPLLKDRTIFDHPQQLEEFRAALTAGQATIVAGRQIHHRGASWGTGSPGTGAPPASPCDAGEEPGGDTP